MTHLRVSVNNCDIFGCENKDIFILSQLFCVCLFGCWGGGGVVCLGGF